MVSLTKLNPNDRRPFLPDVLAAIIQRYKFVGFPTGLEELSAASRSLKMGSWQGAQIDDLSVYNDGLIVTAPQNTDVVDEFIDDLYVFTKEHFGYSSMIGYRENRHYESAVVVELPSNVSSRLLPLHGLCDDLASHQREYGLADFEFQPSRLAVDVDASKHTGKRPIQFTLERRLGEPFEKNHWFSSAPLKSNDHVAVLRKLTNALLG